MRFGWAQTAYNRPNYQEQATASWLQARRFPLIRERAVFLEPSPQQDKMIEAAKPLGEVIVNPRKYGVLVNPWMAFSNMFDRGCDFVILAEDDVLVSDDVIEYFYWAANSFRRDASVAVACAFSRDGGEPDDVKLAQCFASPLVWGFWRRSWEGFIRDTWDKDYSFRGWDWNLDRLMREKGLHSVMPKQSRSTHIGIHGGTHFQPSMAEEAYGTDFKEHREPSAFYRMVEA